MMTLKEFFSNAKKEDIYNYYKSIVSNVKEYKKVTRNEMYNDIISMYQIDPEIILKLCTIEEIQILKDLVNDKLIYNYGYIEYTVLKNLQNKFLILKDGTYYIPEDILNYIKMALNIYNQEYYMFKDISDSVILGLVRIYNVLTISSLNELLNNYNIKIELDIKNFITNNLKFKNLIDIVKYKDEEYIISLENMCYKDVLSLKRNDLKKEIYKLEEVISFGKYKINLFNENIFNYLNFLEMHLDSYYVDMIFNELILYMGFDINEDAVLKKITDNIEELYNETIKILNYFPIWIYNGNNLNSLNKNMILPNKNEPCICGSGKKFKKCCIKKYK